MKLVHMGADEKPKAEITCGFGLSQWKGTIYLENEKYWETPCHGLAYDTRMDRMDWKILWSFMLFGRNSSVWKHAERENCLICILFEFFGKTRNIRHVFVTFKSFLVSSAPSFGISDLCYHVKWNLSRHEK